MQIYETIIAGLNGEVTTGLLTGVRYLKDNRLLPRGFDKRTAEPDIAVVGGAFDDPDFNAASDRIRYSVPVAGAQGPFVVEAELLYQPIGFRWAENLKAYEHAPEPRRFTALLRVNDGGDHRDRSPAQRREPKSPKQIPNPESESRSD